MSRFIFRLFVSGQDPKHQRVADGLTKLLRGQCGERCQLDVVDVRRQPEMAEEDNVLATPTLVRVEPLPALRVVGELAACTRILADLGVRPAEWSVEEKPSRTRQLNEGHELAAGLNHP